MEIEIYDRMDKFYSDSIKLLQKEEAINNLMIGNILEALKTKDIQGWTFGVVKNKEKVELIFLNRPPFNLLMYSSTNNRTDELYEFLAKELSKRNIHLLGVNTGIDICQKFAKYYARYMNQNIKTIQKMRILKLDKLNDISLSDGKFRKATIEDLETLTIFLDEFYKEALEKQKTKIELRKECEYNLDSTYVVEKDGYIVAQAVEKRKLLNGKCISNVYTDRGQRGKGYARTCVYQLSRKLLEEGAKYCVLYTDDANPISNHVYEKIGYVKISDELNISFIDQIENKQ